MVMKGKQELEKSRLLVSEKILVRYLLFFTIEGYKPNYPRLTNEFFSHRFKDVFIDRGCPSASRKATKLWRATQAQGLALEKP